MRRQLRASQDEPRNRRRDPRGCAALKSHVRSGLRLRHRADPSRAFPVPGNFFPLFGKKRLAFFHGLERMGSIFPRIGIWTMALPFTQQQLKEWAGWKAFRDGKA